MFCTSLNARNLKMIEIKSTTFISTYIEKKMSIQNTNDSFSNENKNKKKNKMNKWSIINRFTFF